MARLCELYLRPCRCHVLAGHTNIIPSQKGVYLLRGSSYVAGRPVQEAHAPESRIHISPREEIDDTLRTALQGPRWHLVAATMPNAIVSIVVYLSP